MSEVIKKIDLFLESQGYGKEWCELAGDAAEIIIELKGALANFELLKVAMGMHINADAYSSTFPDNDEDSKYLKKSETYLRLSARNLLPEDFSWECHEAYKAYAAPEILQKLKEIEV